MEEVLAEIEALPDPEELKANFDEDREYKDFIAEFKDNQSQCGEMLWCPADFRMLPMALWHLKYGYEGALMTLALHPDRYRKLIQVSAERGHQKAILRARAIQEGIHPRAILTGEDLCCHRGPMVSPEYLRREYFPLLEYAFEPLLEVGARIVWHCDGDFRPLLNDLLACGVSGFQGFQRECGMELEWIVNLRTQNGERVLIFGPMSVTTTLPHGTPDDVRAEVHRAIDLCREKASLVFFTSNTINPDVPLENILVFWQTVLKSTW